jgi:phosphatidylcholine synthase
LCRTIAFILIEGVALLINKRLATKKISFLQRGIGWCIHLFTASGACVGLLALLAIYQHNLLKALWLMGTAIVIDAVDGMFARMVKIKEAVPEIDGALLDNIVDFFTYTLVPCFFLLVTNLLPESWRVLCVMIITFASAYQFTQVDAKTTDHFFKGFPSYWNIAVFYLFFWQMSPMSNMIILLSLAVLSFVPIKYVYPSRLDYLTNNKFLRSSMVLITILWGAATTGLLWLYPQSNHLLVAISLGYCLLYIGISLYRTWVPLISLEFSADEIKIRKTV